MGVSDRVLFVAVLALTLVCCLSVGGVVLLAASGREPPAILSALASTATGGILGILVVSNQRNGGQR